MRIELRVNGRAYPLDVEPWEILLYVLRDRLRLTGTKYGCGDGECGACTVLLDGKPMNACLILACQAEGAEVLTVEGLVSAGGGLHRVQQAFADLGAVQCGYCTPGFIVSAKALLDQIPRPTRQQVKQGLAGNLCRCTGYKKIFEAVEAAILEGAR